MWRQMIGAAWLWIEIVLENPCFFEILPVDVGGFWIWNTLARQPRAASKLMFNHEGTPDGLCCKQAFDMSDYMVIQYIPLFII